ncbi:MAG: imidazole glycerol phosphate synthase subunit HisH, partial [Candidatus Puniceispirillaceae bacterium]
VHSFAAPLSENTVAACDYGGAFTALVGRGNFMGAQFHPERSGPVGAAILQNFINLPAGRKG